MEPFQRTKNATLTKPENPFSAAVRVSENQRKLIEDKYLKGSPTIEAWLGGVAHNIALAELLYHPSAKVWGLFEGVRVTKREAFQTRFFLFHASLASATERDLNFRRFLQNCEAALLKTPAAAELVKEWETRFYQLLSSWKFLPNSPTLMNAGRELQQLSACYVLPVEDSMEGITSALQAQALIHKSGGGTGFSFERLRPKGDAVKSTAGVASGALSFMQMFDKITEVVKQGGNRRGANMGILPYWHPEIMEFIRLKNRPGVMENFNISVSVDEKFMVAVEKGWEYNLLNPRTQAVEGRLNAREVFNAIMESAWRSGDPGIVFMDRINESNSNPTPAIGKIEATNPCGEQPLLPNEPCNLGSINLSHFVTEEDRRPVVNWEALQETISLAIRFLDNVIDVNNYPLAEIEFMAKTNRRIGLGVMGWSEMLVKLGLPYDSDQALEQAREVMKFVNEEASQASEDLAKTRGVFPNWRNSIYDPTSPHFRGALKHPRHAARTTIAPTGTIGLAAGVQGAGIEPFYAMAYTRYNAKALEAMKNGFAPEPKDVFTEINPLFKEACEKNAYFGLEEQVLWEKIERNNKSIRGIPEIPAEIQALFPISHDISVDNHVKMQAAFQEFTDNAVSKTINLPQTANVDDIRRAYELAHTLKCKGVTVYRDRSKQQQVLNLFSDTKKGRRAHDLTEGVSSEYYEIKTGHGPLHVHIDYDETGPYRVFTSLAPVGTELAGLTAILGIVLSKYFEEGGDPQKILRHLQSIKGDRPYGFGEGRVNSIPHGVAKALRTHLKKHGWLGADADGKEPIDLATKKTAESAPVSDVVSPWQPTGLELWNLTTSDQCPECYGKNIQFSSGCSGPVCQDCGYSECQ